MAVTKDDDEQARDAVALATTFLTAARQLEPRQARARGRRLRRLLDDPDSMAFSLALTDQVARIQDPARATQRLRELLAERGAPSFLGPVDGVLLRAAGRVSTRLPGLVAAGVRWRLRRESAGVVLAAEEPAFTRYVSRRTDEGVRLNVNVLGEAILGDDEARRRLDEVLARVERPDVDYVSVKVSSICAQLSPLAFDRSVERVAERLRVLYRRAADAQPPTFVNLDMEEHGDLALTVAVFQRVLDEPELLRLDAGLALQAYLPDSHEAFEQLATWAAARRARGGGRVKVRIVKGANLAMEQVEAELRGWPQAPYPTKADVDASYKCLLDRALDPVWGDAMRVGLASHNLFDVAWGIVRATHLGSLDRLELEMLEGMAVGEAEAIRRHMHQLLLYAPVVRRDEFDAAIAYLVRRLDENTSADNFLRHQFELTPESPAFAEQRDRFLDAVAARHHISTASRRVQDRGADTRAVTNADAGGNADRDFTNTPDTDWSRPANREWLASHHLRLVDWMPTHLRIPGDAPAGTTRTLAAGVDPAAPDQVLYRYEQADHAAVDAAMATAVGALRMWGCTTTADRAARLRRSADVLAAKRGEAIAVMARDAGKTAPEADVEVSEAIDMARYYAGEALRLDEHEATARPLGPVVVAPPWNFPYAIPAGGVLAALAAGNTVILKPAPETVVTAWLLVTCLWDAGIPRDVLQLLPCPDDDVGRALITHRDVGAVVLTGAAETAERFLSWRPDLRLHAETSGKNAIVITAAADLDLAVKDLVRSAFGHAGQKCSAASLAIVERSVLDEGRFLDKLADATRTLHVGLPTDPAVDVGPLIRPPGAELQRALTTLEPSETWLVRPRQLDGHGYLWSPGIKAGVAPGSFFHLTECFGPVLGVLAADDLDHALALQNATPFGLTGGLQSLDPQEIDRWVAGVEVGNAYVNRGITGAIVRRQPFGGWKRSTVGPAVKAGGPAYVASLCRWTDPSEPPDAVASYAAAWSALARPVDPTGLRVEHNQLRHLPLPGVVLRVGADADPPDEARCRLAAATIGTPLEISREADETDAELVARLADADPRPTRLRVLGTVRAALWRAAAETGIHLDDRAPVGDGTIELLRWCREQAVSSTAHRHGAPSPDLLPALAPPGGP